MSYPTTTSSESTTIAAVIQHDIDGAKSRCSELMKPAFHSDATIFGYIGVDLLVGSIEKLFAWNSENGPTRELQARLTSIDVVDTVAIVRLKLDNWISHCFTDLFTLLKVGGEWKIINKVFHLHA